MSQVKNKESHYIENPFSVTQNTSLKELKAMQECQGIGTILVTEFDLDSRTVEID